MDTISRPFDKDRVENRELAALSSGKIMHLGIDARVCQVLYLSDNVARSYDLIAMSFKQTDEFLKLPAHLMRLVHHGVLSVNEVTMNGSVVPYEYQLSPGMMELINEIKTAVLQ